MFSVRRTRPINGPVSDAIPTIDVEVAEARPDDPELQRWDTEIGGRARSDDLAFWVREQRAIPLWLQRRGERIGYAYVRWSGESLWYPNACSLGPIGVKSSDDAAVCALAVVGWARQRSATLRIDLPGPHPALAPLLDAGFQIVYVETFVSSARTPLFDAHRYVASGASLF